MQDFSYRSHYQHTPPLPSMAANWMRQLATSCDSKHLFVSDNFHTFADVTFSLVVNLGTTTKLC